MDAPLKNFIDQLTDYCQQEDGSGIWMSDAAGLSFRLSEQRKEWAVSAVADVATSDTMIVAASWAWISAAGLMQVGHNLSHHNFDHLESALQHIARDFPSMVTSQMLALFD